MAFITADLAGGRFLRHRGLLERSPTEALAGKVLQTLLAQVTLQLKRLALTFQLVPGPQTLSQLLLLRPQLFADALFFFLQFPVVRFQLLDNSRR